jgi:hypothetical protein
VRYELRREELGTEASAADATDDTAADTAS